MTNTKWEQLTPEELRTAAKVARLSESVYLAAAAAAWEFRADVLEGKEV